MSAIEYAIGDLQVEDVLDDQQTRGAGVRVSFVLTLRSGEVQVTNWDSGNRDAELDDTLALLTRALAELAPCGVWWSMPSRARH